MPQLIPAAIAALSAATIVKGILFVAAMAYSSSQQRKAERKARAAYNAAQVDRLVNVGGTVQPRALVLGRARVGGHVAFRGSVGVNREKFVMLVTLAAHEIDAVEQLWLNDTPVTLDGSGWVQTDPYALRRTETGKVYGTTAPPEAIPGTISTFQTEEGFWDSPTLVTVTTYQYYVTSPKARIRAYLGAAGQTADAQVMADFPTLWTTNHIGSGVAYLVCEFWYDETAFPSGLPSVTATIRGAKCYDPRTSTTAWTENPALHQRHVLTHPYFGKRTSLTADEDARIATAANACDVAHDYGGGAVPMFRSALVVPFGTPARDVLDDLSQAMAGQWAYAQGQFFTRAGIYTAPVQTLTEADLATVVRDADGGTSQQAISISTHTARADKFNVITPRIWDAAQAYKQVPLTPVKSAALITADGVELAQEVDMPAVFYGQQAQHVAGVLMRDARDPLTVRATFKLTAYALELFDVVRLTIPRYGWTEKQFMVLARQWTLGGAIDLTLKETAAAIYQPDAAFVASGYADNTALPRPWDIAPPASLAASSGTAELLRQADGTIITRVRVSWAALTDVTLLDAGQVEVQWAQSAAELQWNSASVTARETQLYLNGAPDGRAIIIRARTRNTLAVSDWSTQLVHTVVGKTEPPPPFDTFLVLAQPDGTRQFNFGYTTTAKPLDWLGAEIRYIAGTLASPVWANMLPLQDDATHYTASPVEANAPLAGEWTFACRSKDTSGNLSTMLVDSITLAARRTGNVYDEFHEELEAWPGTLSGFTLLSDNTLEATDSVTWADLTTWDTWTRWNTTPAANPQYTSQGRDMGTVLSGQVDALVDADGAVTLEISTSPDGSTWGAWTSAASPFTARWVRVRITVAATVDSPVPAVRELGWNVSVDLKREYINDVVISALTGANRIGTGDIRIPLQNTYTVIKRIGVTIQDSSAGAWTWQRVDNVLTGPRLQFKLAGVLADPSFVDFDIEGI